jgi:hypothetical protein
MLRHDIFSFVLYMFMLYLGALAELRKGTVSFFMSVRPSFHISVRMEQLGSHWMELDEI